jgi:type I restriction enzyme R subunit
LTNGRERTEVELPLIEQLIGLGWVHLEGHVHDPAVTERESFRKVLLEERLRASLIRINPGPDGAPWLDERRLGQALATLDKLGAGELIELNQQATKLLLDGLDVGGLPNWNQGRDQKIRFIDWEAPENNDLLVVSQFRVDEPGAQARRWITPDLVLFVNGIPLVVIECKNPDLSEPMASAIEQLRRYANRRELGVDEGSERLFWTNQLVVATHGECARVGTFMAKPDQLLEWKDPAPSTRTELATRLDKSIETLTMQETLVAGVLTPANLLDLVRHFTLFLQQGRETVKIVARYQQYRAALRALERIRSGKTRREDGEHDRRGGVIWHTQGSGKSLTMVFLVRAMRSDPRLRRFKVVVVTDRIDLEKQLMETAALTGDVLQRAKKAATLKTLLVAHGPGLVFAMIQKYRDYDGEPEDEEPGMFGKDGAGGSLGVLNEDEEIVVLVDEAHRSHSLVLHGNLIRALPNATKIGFTGTPIMRRDKKRTDSIFGPYIDTYTIRESETDGATVPILYEGRTAKGAVQEASDLDALFEDMFDEPSAERLATLKERYATHGAVLEAPKLIEAKARNMLIHYVSTVMPGGFKAQVAATSRRAAVRYREALIRARDILVEEIAALAGQPPEDESDRRAQILWRARDQLEMLRALDFVPIISGRHNDDPTWATWTNRPDQEQSIAAFKLPLGPASDHSSPVAFLIVKSMLLTGFDAPFEQVLYLDRFIQDAELLQAIARVNRRAPGKRNGLLVDYCGVGAHLQKALESYAPRDAASTVGALTSIADELPKLRDRHARVIAVFAQAGVMGFEEETDVEACIDALADPILQARFDGCLKDFLDTLEVILPRPEGLPFVADARRLGALQMRARRRYREDALAGFDPSLYGEKVRRLIDEHVAALGIESKIAPISITDPDFLIRAKAMTSDRAKASDMEHALRFHIRRNFDQDPAGYAKLSERLDAILVDLRGKWDQLALGLAELIERANNEGRSTGGDGDPLQTRFGGVLEEELDAAAQGEFDGLVSEVVTLIASESAHVDFWSNPLAQEALQRKLVVLLYDKGALDLELAPGAADRLMELARANRVLFEEIQP